MKKRKVVVVTITTRLTDEQIEDSLGTLVLFDKNGVGLGEGIGHRVEGVHHVLTLGDDGDTQIERAARYLVERGHRHLATEIVRGYHKAPDCVDLG